MEHFLQQMKIAPLNLAARIEQFFQPEKLIALSEIENLVADTIQLVELPMPQIDTSQDVVSLGWCRSGAWEARSSLTILQGRQSALAFHHDMLVFKTFISTPSISTLS